MTIEEKLDRVIIGLDVTRQNLDATRQNLDATRQNLDTLAATVEAQAKSAETTKRNIADLAAVVNTLASSIVAHDNQIEALIQTAERHERVWQDLQKQWQAYLNRLPPQ